MGNADGVDKAYLDVVTSIRSNKQIVSGGHSPLSASLALGATGLPFSVVSWSFKGLEW